LRNMDPQPQVRNCSFRKVYMWLVNFLA
jgi:hypothetical protein